MTNALLTSVSFVLAAFPQTRSRGSANTGQAIIWLLVAAMAIGAVCVGVYFGTRLMHRWRHDSHPSLFLALSRLHGLSRQNRAILKQVATQNSIAHPARLFTEPQWLDPESLKGPLKCRAKEVDALRSLLFASS